MATAAAALTSIALPIAIELGTKAAGIGMDLLKNALSGIQSGNSSSNTSQGNIINPDSASNTSSISY